MQIHEIEMEIRQAIQDIESYGMKYAKARGVSYQLQEQRKVVLAELMKAEDINLPENKRETLARTRERYRQHIEGTGEAIEHELIFKARYEAAYAKYEALRSLMSLTKKQMETI